MPPYHHVHDHPSASVSALQGLPVGRMEFVLFTDKAPRAAENYRLMFSGEKVRNLRCEHRCAGPVSRRLYAGCIVLLQVTFAHVIELEGCISTVQPSQVGPSQRYENCLH